MNFEVITRNAQAQQKKVILASPEALRECADRLEHAIKGALKGESILCDLTPTSVVVFKPDAVYEGYAGYEGRPLITSADIELSRLNTAIDQMGTTP